MKIEKRLSSIFLVLATAMFLLLTYYSLRYSYINESIYLETVTDVKDDVLSNIFFLGAAFLTTGCLAKLLAKYEEKVLFGGLILANVVVVGFSIYWLSCHTFAPMGDQEALVTVAENFIDGNYHEMTYGAGYIRRNPHQLGLTTIYRYISVLLGTVDYQNFQYLNVLLLPLIVTSGYFIIKYIAPSLKEARWFYLFSIILCFPLYAYIPYVYGEISSVAFLLLAIAMMLACLKHFHWYKAILCGIAVSLAIICRQNSLVVMIAIILVLLIKAVFSKGNKALVLAVIVGICIIISQMFISKLYEPYEYEEDYGIPATAYIAMGLDDSDEGAGWYNGYNFIVFCFEAESNVALANELSMIHIEERLTELRETNTLSSFMQRKLVSQWNAPMYQGFVMNAVDIDESEGLVYTICVEDEMKFAEGFANIHQLLIYLGVLCYAVYSLAFKGREKVKIEHLTLLIGIFGGLLFSLIWEAKSRYIFPYYMFMLPYAAIGISELYRFLYYNVHKFYKKITVKDNK